MRIILVTGIAGFIGFHLSKKLVESGYIVIGLDNLNDYYDVELKYERLRELGFNCLNVIRYNELIVSDSYGFNLKFIKMDLEDKVHLPKLFDDFNFDYVCNLAAQAGVRYSIESPFSYIESNIVGFLNLLECCKSYNVLKLVYASSSSVYGLNDDVPFLEESNTDRPVSLYAATKKSNELMAYTYSHLFNFQSFGLRFFTVYGPWGRPDMAPMLFAQAMFNSKEISVFNHGDLSRDFTYIDDIVDGTFALIDQRIESKSDIFNIGRSQPIKLMDFIKALEKESGLSIVKVMSPMQSGDVFKTWASVDKLEQLTGYRASTSLEEGVRRFIDWYKLYYGL